ncbi:hypothetical protein H7J50_25090 [Mycobacterium intermedium]|uniref:hypothetical protein n=1 Tax=Mycobacterium intermedium TaxID=28445 RepID=UPI0012EAFE16|nr:hypothetical protein [Mycobacterium intermedium]MCV6967051.1 hypothetical protein [Mycobacterium intermedium]
MTSRFALANRNRANGSISAAYAATSEAAAPDDPDFQQVEDEIVALRSGYLSAQVQ